MQTSGPSWRGNSKVFYLGFLSRIFTIHKTVGEWETIHPLQRHLDISLVITAESSPLQIASSRIQTENLWFPSASC